jgi:hypothetical protein
VAGGESKTAAGAAAPTIPAVAAEDPGGALKTPNGPVVTPAPGVEFMSEVELPSDGEAESGGEPPSEVEVSGAPTPGDPAPAGPEEEGAGGGVPELCECPRMKEMDSEVLPSRRISTSTGCGRGLGAT